MSERIAEHIQSVRGETRYFAVYDSEFGAIQVTFSRSDENGKDSNADAGFYSTVFRPDWGDRTRKAGSTDFWHYIGALNYTEIEGRDVPKHTDEPEKYRELLREDGERLLERTEAILAATPNGGTSV